MRYGLGLLMIIVLATSLAACSGDKGSGSKGANFLPPMGFRGDPATGRPLFEKNCGACHGRSGEGSQKGPPLVHKIYEPGHHGDFAFYAAASKGVRAHHWRFGDMPPVPGVTAEDVGHIIAHVRQMQRSAGIN